MTLAGGALLVAAAFSVAPVASASVNSAKTCKSANGYKIAGPNAKLICAGISFYRGKTVTFVAPDKPGGGFDQNARIYAPFLADYLGANFVVSNIPAGNTVAGMNFVAGTNSPNPGLTVGWMNVGPIVEDNLLHITGVTFNAAKEVMLGGTAPDLSATAAIVSPACSSWDNGFGALLKANSASNPVVELIQTTGSTTFNMLMIDGVFGIHYRAIAGYASSADLVTGWNRGDGCVITDPVSVISKFIAAGKAKALLVNIPLQTTNEYYSNFVGVPTYLQAEKQFKSYVVNKTQRAAAPVLNLAGNTERVFFVPPKTPKTLQAALAAAFKWASYNPNLMAKFRAIGQSTGWVSGVKAKFDFNAYLNQARRVTEYLTAIGG
ncbi:MAG TPA: hypothetical protein VMU99_08545 [Acidimicrobiales bacterium]|nr:hypothetical protein [Acidimicrobiales bacterium]